jgi:hypothetical protein
MDRSWVAVLSIQLPRCEARRSSGILRWTSVFAVVLLCASAFVGTARAEDRAPPAPDGAPLSSDSNPNDGASAGSPDSSATATETSAETNASAATDTSADATDTTDTSAATDTSTATDTSATTPGATTDTAAATTEATDTPGAAAGTSAATTGTPGATTDTSGAAPSDPSGGSDAQAPDSTSGTASASMEAGASAPTPTPADAGAPAEAGASPTAASGSTDPVPAGSSAPTVRNEATIVLVVPTSGLAPKNGTVRVVRRAVDSRMIVICGLAPLARAPTDLGRVLFGQSSAHETTQIAQPGAGPGGGRSGRLDGASRPGSPRLPLPDRQPQGPIAPGSSPGSGSSGGFHGGADLGLMAAPFSLVSHWGSGLITPFEGRRPALLFAFLLERPG